MNAIAFFWMARMIDRAIINRVHPAHEAKIIRFAAEEIDVLLAHEEIGVIDWIWAVHSFVIRDRHGRRRRSCQSRAGRVAEADAESLVPFSVRVIDDSD